MAFSALHPAWVQFTIAVSSLTTKVVVARVSLLNTIWAFAAAVLKRTIKLTAKMTRGNTFANFMEFSLSYSERCQHWPAILHHIWNKNIGELAHVPDLGNRAVSDTLKVLAGG
jgi:hypothetical protein